MSKVSAIIPIYAVEKCLRQCLDSALSQTLRNIEIILVDDRSKDRYPQICDKYTQKDSLIIPNQLNRFYEHTVNHGMEVATRDYIGIIDTDDPEMFKNLYQNAIKINADFVKADFYKYSGNKNTNKVAHIITNTLLRKLKKG